MLTTAATPTAANGPTAPAGDGHHLGLGPRWLPFANLSAVALVFFFYWTDRNRTFDLIREQIQAQRAETARHEAQIEAVRIETNRLAVADANLGLARAIAVLEQSNRRTERVVERADPKAGPEPPPRP
ncbi:hypothetical protein J0H58_26010 [bacterium]|nr:hypothetical protein [bacterium]